MVRNLKMGLWWKGGIDIVVSHAPPRHVHDAEDRCHKGFKSFHWLINRYAPKYFIHGHIHAHFDNFSDRVTNIDNTKVVNSYGYTILEIHYLKRNALQKHQAIFRQKSRRRPRALEKTRSMRAPLTRSNVAAVLFHSIRSQAVWGAIRTSTTAFASKSIFHRSDLKTSRLPCEAGSDCHRSNFIRSRMSFTSWTATTVFQRPKNSVTTRFWQILSSLFRRKTPLENILYRQRSVFLEKTGLSQVDRPDRIRPI